MCTLRLRETIWAVLCATEGELIAYCALYPHTEKAFPVHWPNWKTSLWIYPLVTQLPTLLSKFRNNNRQVVLLCDSVLWSSSAICQICAHSAPGRRSLLWQSSQILSFLVLADLILADADARKTVFSLLWVQLQINSRISKEPGTFLVVNIFAIAEIGKTATEHTIRMPLFSNSSNTSIQKEEVSSYLVTFI